MNKYIEKIEMDFLIFQEKERLFFHGIEQEIQNLDLKIKEEEKLNTNLNNKLRDAYIELINIQEREKINNEKQNSRRKLRKESKRNSENICGVVPENISTNSF